MCSEETTIQPMPVASAAAELVASAPPSGKGRSAAAVIKKEEPGGEVPALFYRKTNKRGNDRTNTNRGRVKMKGVG